MSDERGPGASPVTPPMLRTARGLADVTVARSGLTDIDARGGRLRYRGYDISDVAALSVEQVAGLMLDGELPDAEARAVIRGRLSPPEATAGVLAALPTLAHVPARVALRSLISLAEPSTPPDEGDPDAPLSAALDWTLVAAVPVLVAALGSRGADALVPAEGEPDDLVGRFLQRLTGTASSAQVHRAVSATFVVLADHGIAASTFAARIATAAGAGPFAAGSAAAAVLCGALHGGAMEEISGLLEGDQPVQEVARRRRLPGFGHRAYRGEDPRALVLRPLAEAVADDALRSRAAELEAAVIADSGAYPNVDLYATMILRAAGVPEDLLTPTFAAARAVGWAAHIREQRSDNRLIRPQADYVGPRPRRMPSVR